MARADRTKACSVGMMPRRRVSPNRVNRREALALDVPSPLAARTLPAGGPEGVVPHGKRSQDPTIARSTLGRQRHRRRSRIVSCQPHRHRRGRATSSASRPSTPSLDAAPPRASVRADAQRPPLRDGRHAPPDGHALRCARRGASLPEARFGRCPDRSTAPAAIAGRYILLGRAVCMGGRLARCEMRLEQHVLGPSPRRRCPIASLARAVRVAREA